MSLPSPFPPPVLNLNGPPDQTIRMLYRIFSDNFINSTTFHNGLKVIINNVIELDGQGMEEGFWHVITQGKGIRLVDFRRSERLHWAKPMMENHLIPEIKCWDYDEGTKKKGIRTYIWLENHDYVLILQKKKNIFVWITAYYVDSYRTKQELERKFRGKI